MRLVSKLPAFCLVAATATLALAVQGMPAWATPRSAATPSPGVKPRAVGDLDCNGLSPLQRPLKPTLACADPRGSWDGRFYEHGRYIGHDEPSVRFLSSVPGSGSNITFTERLPKDPTAAPTVAHPGHDVTHWVELSTAPWTLAKVGDACVWEFGAMPNGNTFGGDRQYGKVGPGTIGAFTSQIRNNPHC
jgi:hypothetical protein